MFLNSHATLDMFIMFPLETSRYGTDFCVKLTTTLTLSFMTVSNSSIKFSLDNVPFGAAIPALLIFNVCNC